MRKYNSDGVVGDHHQPHCRWRHTRSSQVAARRAKAVSCCCRYDAHARSPGSTFSRHVRRTNGHGDRPGFEQCALLSIGVTLIALFLGLRQWYERQARDPDLSALDRSYFFRQDVRRGAGVAIMLILAAGLYVGSRVSPKVDGHANLLFVQIWLIVSALIVLMLGLALIDWVATRLYARRYRQYLLSERTKLIRETLGKSPKEPPPGIHGVAGADDDASSASADEAAKGRGPE